MVATENNKLHLINKANEKRTLLDRKKLKLLYNITSTCSYTNKHIQVKCNNMHDAWLDIANFKTWMLFCGSTTRTICHISFYCTYCHSNCGSEIQCIIHRVQYLLLPLTNFFTFLTFITFCKIFYSKTKIESCFLHSQFQPLRNIVFGSTQISILIIVSYCT